MKIENKRDKWLHVRLTLKEYERIQSEFAVTVHDNFSDYARKLLLKKPVIGRCRDTGMQEILEELAALRRDLHGLATNYNQLAKKLNSVDENEQKSYLVQGQKFHKGVLDSLDLVQRFINHTTEKWLQS